MIVYPKQGFLAIIVVESQGLPTMTCQTKYGIETITPAKKILRDAIEIII